MHTPVIETISLREALEVIENLGHSVTAYDETKNWIGKCGGRWRQVTVQFEELHKFKPITPGTFKDAEKCAFWTLRLLI